MCLFDCWLLLRIKTKFLLRHLKPLRPLRPHLPPGPLAAQEHSGNMGRAQPLPEHLTLPGSLPWTSAWLIRPFLQGVPPKSPAHGAFPCPAVKNHNFLLGHGKRAFAGVPGTVSWGDAAALFSWAPQKHRSTYKQDHKQEAM